MDKFTVSNWTENENVNQIVCINFRHSSRFLRICGGARSKTEIEAKNSDGTGNSKSERINSGFEAR
jgi:hypothetical protein